MDRHKNKTNEVPTNQGMLKMLNSIQYQHDEGVCNNNIVFVPIENIRSIERIIDDWGAVKRIIKRESIKN